MCVCVFFDGLIFCAHGVGATTEITEQEKLPACLSCVDPGWTTPYLYRTSPNSIRDESSAPVHEKKRGQSN